MQIKEGSGRKAGYNDKKGVYGAEVVFRGSWDCYEISAEVFNSLTKGMRGSEAEALITGGRHLYMHVNDCCGPPYSVVLDDDYRDYCPGGSDAGKVWSEELTDAAVELSESEKVNRGAAPEKAGRPDKEEKVTRRAKARFFLLTINE